MKRKGITVALLLLVATVWGGVLWKVIRQKEDDAFTPTATPAVAPMEMVEGRIDSFPDNTALGDYRDPFLKEPPPRNERKAAHPAKAGAGQAVVRPVASVFKWPRVEYRGSMKNAKQGRVVAMLSIDGREIMLPLGAEDHGIQVRAVFTDSVQLLAGNEQRTFAR